MGLVVSDKGGSYTPPPEGSHIAVCVQVIDLGTQYSEFYKKSAKKVLIGWELVNEMNNDGEPWLCWKRYTASLSEKAALRADLKSWRGREFTKEELDSFQLRTIIGAPCMLSITHQQDGNTVYGNVSAVMALPKGAPRPTATHTTIVFDIEEWEQSVFATFRENLQKTIMASDEAKTRFAGGAPIPGSDENQHPGEDQDVPF